MAIVIVGAGRVGSRLVDLAIEKGDRVVLVEREHNRAEEAREQWVIEVIHGDATQAGVLRRAGVPDVEGVIATTRDDPTNLMVCLLAKELGTARAVALVNAPEARAMFESEEIETVGNPSHLAAEALYRGIELPRMQRFMRLGEDYEVFTTRLEEKDRLAGKSVREAGFSADVLVAAVQRGGRVILPRGEFVLQGGDVLTMVAPIGLTRSLLRRFKTATGLDQLLR